MSESCCKPEATCCAPPLLILPTTTTRPTAQATCGTADDGCCPKGVPVFDGVDPRYKHVLWTVIAINGVMFFTEMAAG